MKARGGEVVRAPVALALVKLVRHLQPEAARALLPRTLQGVANMLRSRLQRIRCAPSPSHHCSGSRLWIEDRLPSSEAQELHLSHPS